MTTVKQKKTCPQGHSFFKSSDCPSCPVCEALIRPGAGFLSRLSSPARNALLHYGIDTVAKLAGYTEKEILSLHGMGKASLPALKQSLENEGLQFKVTSAKE